MLLPWWAKQLGGRGVQRHLALYRNGYRPEVVCQVQSCTLNSAGVPGDFAIENNHLSAYLPFRLCVPHLLHCQSVTEGLTPGSYK